MKKFHLLSFLLLPLLGCSQQAAEPRTTQQPSANEQTDLNSLLQINQIQEQNRKDTEPTLANKYLLDVPLIRQNPELKYGCEVTSLAMVLQYAGVNTNKMELYSKIRKDPDPIVRSKTGDILKWGNPQDGFVGDMTGRFAGYAVFDKPMEELINLYLPDRAVNLTNRNFDEVLLHVAKGYPVVVWTTGDYRLPDRLESWLHGNEVIHTPLDLHAVVLVGFDEHNVYINDPLSGKKQHPVNKQQFIGSWKALQCRAVSYR
jgi:uncharacterized protein YvpB